MITQEDIGIIVKAFTPVLKEFIAIAVAEAIKALPLPKDGEPGPQGPPGEAIIGPRGEKGESGADAPPLDTQAIIEGLRAYIDAPLREGLAAIPIPKDGRDGRDGKDGRDGIAKDGRDGKDGEAGRPGRDAFEIDILPMIPETPVPRGTFAQHKGGLWRAIKNTDNIEDWNCVVCGLDHVEIEQIDTRNFAVIPVLSTGPSVAKTFSMPALIYLDIYKDGVDYQRGDTVTWSGNLWHCQVETTKTKPGTSTDWRLMVRAGRDGKDFREAKEPEPAKPVRLR